MADKGNMVYIHTIEFSLKKEGKLQYVTTWEDIMLSKISQS